MGKPMQFVLTEGQRSDVKGFQSLNTALKVKRIGRGKPKQRPRYLVGDKGYDAQMIRRTLRRQHTTPVIPKRKNAKHKPRFNRGLYRERNRIERLINRLKQFRRVATRTRKTSRELPSYADDCSNSYLVEIAHYATSRLCRYALVNPFAK